MFSAYPASALIFHQIRHDTLLFIESFGFCNFYHKKVATFAATGIDHAFFESAHHEGVFVRVYSESLLEIFEVSVLAASVTVSLAVDAAPATA